MDTNIIDIGNAESKGEGVFAKRVLSTRDIIHTIHNPALAAISTPELTEICYNCYAGSEPAAENDYSIGQHRDARLQICTGCRVARFCGKSCQTKAWRSFHKHECKMFVRLESKGTLPESARAVLRFVLQHDNDLLSDGIWTEVLSLESHLDELKNNGDDWAALNLMTKACKEYSRTGVDFSTVLKLLCILKVNGMTLTTTYGDEIGVFLDPILSKMNHSCDGGNAFIHRPVYTNFTGWPSKTSSPRPMMKLLPLRKISKNEELSITYIEQTASFHRRRDSLAKQYMFTCSCDKCQHDQEALETMKQKDPEVFQEVAKWSDTVEEQSDRLKFGGSSQHIMQTALESLLGVATAMRNSSRFVPDWDPYPRAIDELRLLQMRLHAYDQVLFYALEQYCIVAPAIYPSSLDPHRTIQALFLLQILRMLAETYDFPGAPPELLRQRVDVERRGFTKLASSFWRMRICVEFRNTLSQSAADDLAQIFTMEQKAIGLALEEAPKFLHNLKVRDQAEKEARIFLRISQEEWDEIMRRRLR